jgi:2-C-methyl-D-erythritol 4-phosphate cytidylyltransferase / 2-C-methyl-D-erythritol 2,4-cyclodiphosphate synthase
MPGTTALIVAGGQGLRARRDAGDPPKQYARVAGRPVLRWALEPFLAHPAITEVRVVIGETDRDAYQAASAGTRTGAPVLGGSTRQHSVRNGLEALASDPPAKVLIHDGARPFVSRDVITRVIDALDAAEAAAPLLPVADTLRRAGAGTYEIVPRENLLRSQTPQGFHFARILDAHRRFAADAVTDDVALAERAGLSFRAVDGDEMNIKLTTPEDFALAERLARGAGETRSATGYDVHRFTAGDHVWLCGIKVPHSAGLEGHSDADAGLHALTDAILGTIAAGDIGMHFPPSDERWRGAPSHLFLAHAADLLRKEGGEITHLDVTLICERPKVGPHRDAMRRRIAEILRIDERRVSVKATTTEGLGFTGRSEGLAAQAIATVRLPL